MSDEHPPYNPEAKEEIRVDLESLYRAGKIGLPTRAAAVASAAQETSSMVSVLNSRSAMMGDPQVMLDVMEIVADCHNALTVSAQMLENCALGLIYVAEDFAERDGFAGRAFAGIQDRVDQEAAATPPPTPDIPETEDVPGLLTPGDGEAGSLDTPQDPTDEQDDRDDQLDDDLDDLTPPAPDDLEDY